MDKDIANTDTRAVRHCYRFSVDTTAGRMLRDFWNAADRAERKAERYAKKMGAESWYGLPEAFAGGVAYLLFSAKKDGARFLRAVDTDVWRKAAEIDGEDCYEPNVRMRTGAYMLPSAKFTPSNTAKRLYQKRHCTFAEVSRLHTVRQWFDIGAIPWNPSHTDELRRSILEQRLGKRVFVLYNEYEGMSQKKNAAARAVRAEMMRAQLPVIGNEKFYRFFGVPESQVPTADSTPTFFVYHADFYISVPMQLSASYLEEVTPERYTYCMNIAKYEAKLIEQNADEEI